MLLVLDGPDACGKTTLAEGIQAVFKDRVKVIHHIYEGSEAKMWDAYVSSIRQAQDWQSQHQENITIFDRFWPSEVVYSLIYRQKTKLWDHFIKLDRCVQRLDGLYVWCIRPTVKEMVDAHAKTHQTGRELYEPDSRIEAVADYFHYIAGCKLRHHISLGWLDIVRAQTNRNFVYTLDEASDTNHNFHVLVRHIHSMQNCFNDLQNPIV